MRGTTIDIALLSIAVVGLLGVVLYLEHCCAAAEAALLAGMPGPCVCPPLTPMEAVPPAEGPTVEEIDRVLRVHRLPDPKTKGGK